MKKQATTLLTVMLITAATLTAQVSKQVKQNGLCRFGPPATIKLLAAIPLDAVTGVTGLLELFKKQ